MKTMFVYAVLALGWASSAWPQGFSSYVPRYIAQPFAPTSDETCKTLQLHPHRSPRPVVSPDAVLGHQDTMTRPRASRALGDCACSRAEILLRYSLPFCDRVLQLSGKRNPTVRDFMHYTGRGRLENPWVGSPKDIADRLEEWFTERACNGFVVGPTYLPGTFEEFVRLVIPELQRRGVYRKEYAGTTLRDHLGLARPEVGAWRH